MTTDMHHYRTTRRLRGRLAVLSHPYDSMHPFQISFFFFTLILLSHSLSCCFVLSRSRAPRAQSVFLFFDVDTSMPLHGALFVALDARNATFWLGWVGLGRLVYQCIPSFTEANNGNGNETNSLFLIKLMHDHLLRNFEDSRGGKSCYHDSWTTNPTILYALASQFVFFIF